jgi:hypothetical protein
MLAEATQSVTVRDVWVFSRLAKIAVPTMLANATAGMPTR